MTLKKFINNFEEYFVVWSLAIMTALVFVQVVMRYIFHNSLSWSEELARYIFLWLSWTGASYAVRERTHFRVEMLANVLKGRSRKIFELVILFVWFLFSFFLTWYGTALVIFLMDTGQVSAAMRLPMSLTYASVPVGCGLMCIRLIIEIQKIIKGGVEA
ncbi:MAG: TRAP transporter small permease [Synergistaceae bacterium]|jgi:TRAP-type C4-dicarboxylate transport system permease small subunit|nr:TRAP transporter small permease [Synergistaceae bacterium]